jgi:hypothetical protein
MGTSLIWHGQVLVVRRLVLTSWNLGKLAQGLAAFFTSGKLEKETKMT